MSHTLASSAAIVMEAGASINSSAAASAALLARFSDNAEGVINTVARYDFINKYPTASSGSQFLLSSTAAKIAAIDLIKYDMATFPLKTEAENRITLLNFQVRENLKLISEDKNRQFLIDGSTGVN